MAIAILILIAISIILIISNISFRRRIKKISRQLAFINTNETNMIVTSNYGNSADAELAGEINKLIFHFNQLRKEYLSEESRFKDSITSLSHDIRTPLTSLDGYFQLLMDSESEEERNRYISIIRERISSLSFMLEELFTYAKLQDHSYQMDIEHVELNKILYESIFSFYDDFKRRNIEPEIDIPDQPVLINANLTALKRAMQNIIKNSIEHGRQQFSLDLEEIGGQAIITFKNNRESADEIDVDHVFERFYKADVARRHTSTGLGLSIAKEIIEKMDGKINAFVEEDTFIIKISMHINGKR